MAQHIEIGKTGEDIAVKHFVKQGFEILEQNYRKKWGEIDIIAQKNKILHFIEVKTVSYETHFEENFPEQNVHSAKRRRLKNAVQTYLAEKHVSYETEFQVDIASVYFNPTTGENKIRILDGVIL